VIGEPEEKHSTEEFILTIEHLMHVFIERIVVYVLFDLHLFRVYELLFFLTKVVVSQFVEYVVGVREEVVGYFIADVLVLFISFHNIVDFVAFE
jgi:hypothetical protein